MTDTHPHPCDPYRYCQHILSRPTETGSRQPTMVAGMGREILKLRLSLLIASSSGRQQKQLKTLRGLLILYLSPSLSQRSAKERQGGGLAEQSGYLTHRSPQEIDSLYLAGPAGAWRSSVTPRQSCVSLRCCTVCTCLCPNDPFDEVVVVPWWCCQAGL